MNDLMDWTLCFRRKYGFSNRARILSDLTNFLQDNDVKKMAVNGKCILGGYVYGHRKFADDSLILTSNIVTIAKEDDSLCATTASGNNYYISIQDAERGMKILLKDAMDGKINDEPGFYLDEPYKNEELFI